jgi:hypothetical protein
MSRLIDHHIGARVVSKIGIPITEFPQDQQENSNDTQNGSSSSDTPDQRIHRTAWETSLYKVVGLKDERVPLASFNEE